MVFLCFFAFFTVFNQNRQPFSHLDPGKVQTHFEFVQSEAVIPSAPLSSPTDLTKAVAFTREQVSV